MIDILLQKSDLLFWTFSLNHLERQMLRFFVFSLCFSLFSLPGWAAEQEPAESPGVETPAEAPPAATEAPPAAGSEEVGELAEAATEEEAEETVEVAPEEVTEEATEVVTEAPPAAADASAEAFAVDLAGYVRVGYASMTPNRFLLIPTPATDKNSPYVGRNDGFSVENARLNVRAKYGEKLYVRLGFDGAGVSQSHRYDPMGHLSTGLRDAYFGYVFGSSTALSVGRFKPPFEMEGLMSSRDQLFVHASLESRGVACHEGYCEGAQGMSSGRQMGMIVRDDFLVPLGAFDMGYALAVTNGNAGGATLNDNDLPAVYGRLMVSWGEARYQQGHEEGPAGYVRVKDGGVVGLVGSWNDVTYGEPPNRSQDRELGFGLDVAVGVAGFTFQSQLLLKDKTHLQAIAGEKELELGGHAQVGYEVLEGLEVGARLAYYNPRIVSGDDSFDQADYDMVAHVTAGVRYACPEAPVVVWGEYTHAEEDSGDQLNNDRVEFAAQVSF